METEPLNGSEEVTPMLATSFPDNHSEIQSAHSIQETSLIINDDAKLLETNSQWQEAKVEGPPTSCDSDPSYEDSIDESMDNDEDEKPKLTTHQKLSMVLIILATLANTMSFSILAAFFPIEAEAKGMSQSVIGFVFTAYSLASSIGSPICGKFLPVVGARFMFIAGSFLAGGSNMMFGLVGDMPTLATFTAFCFLLRVVEGLGLAASFTSASAILAHTFPDDKGTVVSVNEVMVGIGFAAGPAIGGLLYQAGGFRLPFFICGGFDLLVVVINVAIMPQYACESRNTGSFKKVLTLPAMWLALGVSLIVNSTYGFMDPTLALHLEELQFDVVEISCMFGLFGGSYAIASIFWGYIADKKKNTRILISIGSFGCAMFFFFLGPSPLLNINPHKYIIVASIVIGAVSMAMVAMPTLVDMFITSQWYGLPQGLGDMGVISGLWLSSTSIGVTVGAPMGGLLTDHLGFNKAGTVLAGVYIATMLVICFFGLWEFRCGKGRREPRKGEL
ncbi:MFS-type transporter SLC18B1-like isoform X2 [Asterias amurensis]|uniref:MFS-type transporter SLC18B1-like isoform X2 n=1 Tax=Asterias amurensis TaxID=7602 RepID=UPI003AB21EA6